MVTRLFCLSFKNVQYVNCQFLNRPRLQSLTTRWRTLCSVLLYSFPVPKITISYKIASVSVCVHTSYHVIFKAQNSGLCLKKKKKTQGRLSDISQGEKMTSYVSHLLNTQRDWNNSAQVFWVQMCFSSLSLFPSFPLLVLILHVSHNICPRLEWKLCSFKNLRVRVKATINHLILFSLFNTLNPTHRLIPKDVICWI